MGRTSKKNKHNSKSLRRYKKKELRDFIKEHKLSIKRTSKLTKTEIIADLLKLQRHCKKTNKCMALLPLKDKKLLTPLQQQSLIKGQMAMKERLEKMKQQVIKSRIPDKISKIPVTRDLLKELKDELKREEKPPTQLELIKNQGVPNQVFDDILNLDDLINRAEKVSERDLDYFKELLGLIKKEEEKKEEEKKEEEKVEEEMPAQIPETEIVEDKYQEEQHKKEISLLTIKEIKKILKEYNISREGKTKKSDLVDIVYNNRDAIDNLQDLIEAKLKKKK